MSYFDELISSNFKAIQQINFGLFKRSAKIKSSTNCQSRCLKNKSLLRARKSNRIVKSLLYQALYYITLSSLRKKNYLLTCSLTSLLSKFEKSSCQYFKTVFVLGPIYSFPLVTFFINISAAPSFKDEQTTMIPQH